MISSDSRSAETSSTASAFDAWADTYDCQANPMLSLEGRYLKRLLPSTNGKRILDAGCGTGRWLSYLSNHGDAFALYGLDASNAMLGIARAKQIPRAELACVSLLEIPLERNTIDLALSSFVLSYVEDIHACGVAFSQVLREGADLFITDVHPETARALRWKRGPGTASLQSQGRTIEAVVSAFKCYDLHLVGHYEPHFGAEEVALFQEAAKMDEYDRACGKPAIYILHFKLSASTQLCSGLNLARAQCVLGAGERIVADLRIAADHIVAVGNTNVFAKADAEIDLSGYTLFPGLINPHDHLEFALFPRLGNPPYADATAWAHDIQSRFQDTIALHKQVPADTRLWWGGLRNLLCGVTTVCHHNPYEAVFEEAGFPVKVLAEFGWAHSLSFGADVAVARAEAEPAQPFILHACEGVSQEAQQEFARLWQLDALTDGTVLVHGLTLTPHEIDALNIAGGAVIRCPSSNDFLFGITPTLENDRRTTCLAIGSDSPLTSAGDLLDEVRFCHHEMGYKPEELFGRVFEGASRVLRLSRGEGRIAPNAAADLIAVRSRSVSPSEHLASLSWKDVELVVVSGVIRLTSSELWHRLPAQLQKGLECIYVDGVERWVRAPVRELFESAAAALGDAGVSLNGRCVALAMNAGGELKQEATSVW